MHISPRLHAGPHVAYSALANMMSPLHLYGIGEQPTLAMCRHALNLHARCILCIYGVSRASAACGNIRIGLKRVE
jgi:hypothetical protein